MTTIAVERRGESSVEANRTPDGWTITQPYAYIAPNVSAWDRLAATLAEMTNVRTIESQLTDTSVYGLAEPSLRVLVGISGSVEQIDFGRLDPTQAYRYARTGKLGLFLTPASVYEELNKPLLSLRDRTVFKVAADRFSRIKYRAEANAGRPEPLEMEFERLDTGEWRMLHPIAAPASRKKLEALAAELQLLQGRNYIDNPESLSDYGLAKPFAHLTVESTDGGSQTLHLGWIDDSDDEAGLFVQRDGEIPVFIVDAGFISVLPESVDDMRESRLFTREAAKLSAFTYRDASQTMRFEIDADGAWRLIQPPAEDTDQLSVSSYISILKQLEAETYPDSVDDSEPRITLDFEFSDGQPGSQIRIGGPVPDSDPPLLHAWSDNGTAMTLPFNSWILLKAEPFKFRDKRMFPVRADEISAVELILEGSKYRFEKEEGRWRVVLPEGHFFESQDDARAMLDALVSVKALAIVTPHGGNEVHGLDTPAVDVQVFILADNGEQQLAGRLVVGNVATEQGRHRFASVSTREGILLLEQSFVDDLRRALEGVTPR